MNLIEQLTEKIELAEKEIAAFRDEQQEKLDNFIKQVNDEINFRNGKVAAWKETLALLTEEKHDDREEDEDE